MIRALLVALVVSACHHPAPREAPIGGSAPPVAAPDAAAPPTLDAPPVAASVVVDAAPAPPQDLDSKDILAREGTADEVEVHHILIAWQDLAPAYRGHMDPRAEHRTNAEAAALALDIAAKLRADPKQLEALQKQYSEDPGTVGGGSYTVEPGSGFVPEFKALALRLHDGEVGIVATTFGYHVMVREPPDPLVSWAILARAQATELAWVQHVLIGWTTTTATDPRARQRTKAQADALAKATFVKARGGADMAKLMAQLSEDAGSAPSGKAYDVTPTSPMAGAFRAMALRLRMGEVGLVKTQLGWHVMKRVPPPPPDSLESRAILARKPVTAAAKVKHVLLGWNAASSGDPRGTARTRAELEKLVRSVLARLRKGEAIEAIMAELSEDPGSAKAGTSYDVTPTAALVRPFLELSLRLNVGEVGVVKTEFGIHIIKRVE